VAIDGTKVHANAGRDANSDYEEIAREILEQADAVDRQEDERYGERMFTATGNLLKLHHHQTAPATG
ncbi:MAG: hypothetical protein ACRDN8_23985, partial [Thermoleophilaceae bacterium]